jgi:hypothetical protein
VANWLEPDVAAQWDDFPAEAVPRPIVLLGTRLRIEGGFIDEKSKFAWLEGVIGSETPVPPAVLGLLPARRDEGANTSLTITKVTATTAPFWCDRGTRELPAYRLQVTGLQGTCVTLAPEAEYWWPRNEADEQGGLGSAATIDDDDVTIHFPAFGGVLTEFHRAEFQEHAAYVVGRAITSQRDVPPGTMVIAVGVIRKVTGRLTAPLGQRVLLNTSGHPIAVIPSGDDVP